jgi:formylglycine-generating enzyme required for sulfatase activity
VRTPLLAFTLERLYAKGGEDGVLTLEEYRELFPEVKVQNEDGTTTAYRGVSAAIKHTADEILADTGYASLHEDDPRKRELRRAFYSLAQVSEAGEFTRRTALWSQMPDSCAQILHQFVGQRLLVSSVDSGEPTLSVAHESLFRVWDTLHGWLLQDRKALALRSQIEGSATEWDAAQRAESRQWPEERILDAMGEIGRSGVSLDDVARPEVVHAFLGPTDPEALSELPALCVDQDESAGSGRYGDAWHLPLGHEARASVGVRLALLGDRRRGVGLRSDDLPDIDWCPIEGSEVTIEIHSDPNDVNSDIVDTLTRTEKSFSIARYPVTIAQFQTFMKECHQEGKWHLPTGLPFDFPADYPAPKHRARHGNHPADGVNWWDTAAFCHWLSTRLGHEVRLPTEFQWQLAATGGDAKTGEPKRVYPWGHDWDLQRDPWRANTIESDLNRATAVGLYPLGASPSGVLDMAGTVWEWCLNAFEDPENTAIPSGQQDSRVLRGGSWYGNQDIARSAYRSWDNPNYRYNDVGVRVLCSSPIVEH